VEAAGAICGGLEEQASGIDFFCPDFALRLLDTANPFSRRRQSLPTSVLQGSSLCLVLLTSYIARPVALMDAALRIVALRSCFLPAAR
jgi:hypothetical protein